MNIKANMRVDFDSFKNTTTVATGWVEIEGIFKFPVSVRKWLVRQRNDVCILSSEKRWRQVFRCGISA